MEHIKFFEGKLMAAEYYLTVAEGNGYVNQIAECQQKVNHYKAAIEALRKVFGDADD